MTISRVCEMRGIGVCGRFANTLDGGEYSRKTAIGGRGHKQAEDRLSDLHVSREADKLIGPFLLLQVAKRGKHAGLPMAPLVRKAGHSYVECENAGVRNLLSYAINIGGDCCAHETCACIKRILASNQVKGSSASERV